MAAEMETAVLVWEVEHEFWVVTSLKAKGMNMQPPGASLEGLESQLMVSYRPPKPFR